MHIFKDENRTISAELFARAHCKPIKVSIISKQIQ